MTDPTRPAANVEAEPVAISAAKVWQDARNAYHANTKPDPDNPRFSIPGTTEAAAVIASAIEQVRKDADARIEALEALLKVAGEALEKIERTPAWGYPDKWETTPAEVRQLARAALAKLQEPGHDDQ